MVREPPAVLDRVPCLAGSPREVAELPGGLTNRNFKIATPGGTFVARVFSESAGLLSIDRDHEYANSVIAAQTVGAPVIDYRPADRVLVLGFLPGRTLTSADLADPATLSRVAAGCRRLHQGARFVCDFDMFEVQARYLTAAAGAGVTIPAGYGDLAPAFLAARSALSVCAEGTVPCNNDLLAANFIDDGDRVWLIDYEYSGNNDPCFELGNIAGECGLSPDALAALVTAYYGRARRSRIARAELFRLVSRYGWTLWGAIQHATSPLDADFWAWGTERFEVAARGFTSPGYAGLLDRVAAGD